MNHPFRDGNKRSAFAAVVAFLRMNGWNFEMQDQVAADMMLELIAEHRDKRWLADRLRAHSKPMPSLELRDFFGMINYEALAAKFASVAAGPINERVASTLEAAKSAPCINEANIGAMHAEKRGDSQSAEVLRQHAVLLTALYRLAEDMGYEW